MGIGSVIYHNTEYRQAQHEILQKNLGFDLCFHPTLSKIYSIYSIEDEVIQQAALWPKLGREAETAKVESTDLCPEGEAVIVTAGVTAGGLVLGGSVMSS